ncbi:MAG: hypothetical protein AAGA48_27615 [Myxococcota bacterium]
MIEINATLQDIAALSLVRFVDVLEGIPQHAVYVGVRGKEGRQLVEYAAANEFGTADGRVPERSYLRRTVDRNAQRYADLLQEAVEDALDHEVSTLALEQIGAIAVGDVQRTIVELRTPPNAPSTIAQKGSSNPLIDSGRLRQSIDYEVRDEVDAFDFGDVLGGS